MLRVKPQCIVPAAQPRQLAFGQLAGGENGAIAEFSRLVFTIKVLPRLPLADGADRGQIKWRGMRG